MRNILFPFFLLVNVVLTHAQHNVILIIADDLGTDYLGFYEDHQDTAAMPNLRRLQQNGVRFTNAMANPICSPTRASMLTGRYSFRTGVGDAVAGASTTGTLKLDEKTIPQLLEEYQPNIAKANIGKWHLNSPTPTSNLTIPNQLGYDYFSGLFIGALPDYYNWTKVTNGVSSTVTTYATTETVNDAISWISAQNNPFFLWLAFNAPHTPLHLPPAGLHSYTNLTGTTQSINQQPEAYYKASLEALDHEIGRLLDDLEANGKLANTDIIFLGDNGDPKQVVQNGLASRAKGTLYQNGVKVPLFISGPSVVKPGRVSDVLVNTVDLFATIQEMFGNMNWAAQIHADKPVDSQSLMPVLQNECGYNRPWAMAEFFKTTADPTNGKAIRNDRYKLLRYDDGTKEFYDLDTDPNELNNLLNTTLNAGAQAAYNYLSNALTEATNLTNPAISAWLRNTTGLKGRHYVQGNPTPIQDNVSANVQSVQYSTNWVYVDASGIPAYITGPFLDGNPSLATEQTGYFKFPLNPVQNTGTPTATTPGNIGAFINGVALFDYRDGVAWNTTTNALCGGPGNPPCPGGMGTPQAWNRDAVVAERAGFDCSKAHPAMGNYHHHQNPSAFNLDQVVVSSICDLYPADGLYVIDETAHAPLIGFAYDGFPIYGAFAYKNTDGTGGITRMKSGYRLRNITVRTHHADGTNVADGPPVSATYPLGYFREDYEFVASTDPDVLDVHNGRFCVTPEYPNGIYCYFATVDEDFNSAYPYAVGPTFYGVKSASKVATISEPVTTWNGEPLAAETTVCPVKCYGEANGEINLFVNGGNAPYLFNWGNGIATQNRVNLVAGTYTVTITDATGQSVIKTATITQPASGVVVTATASAIDCFGAATGSVLVNVTGGEAGYSFQWQDGNTSEDRLGLPAGNYRVTVTDGNGCSVTASAQVTQPASALSAAADVTQIACFGEDSGSISLSVTGGTPGYIYQWLDGSTMGIRSGLSAGNYAVTTTDANGCTTALAININQPESPLAASADVTSIPCYGDATGSIQMNITGGTPAYTFLWNDAANTPLRDGLLAGDYAVTVTDANGCSAQVSANISQPTQITNTLSSTDASCGDENGAISMTTQGGVAPYSFLWSNGATTEDIGNLSPGAYFVNITDQNNCVVTRSASISNVDGASATASPLHINCHGQATGAIDLQLTGGAEPYTCLWNDGSNDFDRVALLAGLYIATITDANGCQTIITQTLEQPAMLIPAGNTTAEACGQGNGTIMLTVAGGVSPYHYTWNNGMTDPAIGNLDAGNYTVVVTDANACSAMLEMEVGAVSGATVTSTAIPVACFGTITGGVDLTLENGTAPFTFFWNNGAMSQHLSNVGAGTYTVTVTDFNGCTTETSAIVTAPAAGLSVTTAATPSSNLNDGSASASASGGTPPYHFLWENGVADSIILNLAANTYGVTVTDGNGCTAVSQAVVDFVSSTDDAFDHFNLAVFPIPASDFIAVQVKGLVKHDLLVKLTTIDGKIIMDRLIGTGSTMCYFDVSTLYDGAYFVTLSDGQSLKSMKVIVAH